MNKLEHGELEQRGLIVVYQSNMTVVIKTQPSGFLSHLLGTR